ncbi:MAG TPA: polysaccharide deacetylase family protein [Blastocatellia bacterium]|jgi:peptidoglycan/xylan/chitin deacetylase (PgdA/CDA1 family)|nr:polysaccharide deacetylase family protein [Blastocatellia bacterium]
MLKRIKKLFLCSCKTVGVFALASRSRWRRNRLLILAYHGVSLDDEHLWDPELYMSPKRFGERMKLLKQSGCTVLPLGEALHELYEGRLPEMSVALTFDDGAYDFYEQAYPIINYHKFPVTIYLTTFFSEYNRPVFDVACSYLLWKGQNRAINLKEFTGLDIGLDLSKAETRAFARGALLGFARQNSMTAEERDAIAARLAQTLNIDYEVLLKKRLLHLLAPHEVRELASAGVDIQLHTHRHRNPEAQNLFAREINDNRSSIQAMTGSHPSHFCYPGNVYSEDYSSWLRELGVVSATTCECGIASRRSNPMLLPRLVDNSLLSRIEFQAWLSGVASVLPRRSSAE